MAIMVFTLSFIRFWNWLNIIYKILEISKWNSNREIERNDESATILCWFFWLMNELSKITIYILFMNIVKPLMLKCIWNGSSLTWCEHHDDTILHAMPAYFSFQHAILFYLFFKILNSVAELLILEWETDSQVRKFNVCDDGTNNTHRKIMPKTINVSLHQDKKHTIFARAHTCSHIFTT